MIRLQITQDPTADQVLTEDPFALLAGMMLDQQFPMERAFRGPGQGARRFGTLDPAAIAAADPEEFADLCATPPADPPLRALDGARLQALAALVVEPYDGDAARPLARGDHRRRARAGGSGRCPASAGRRRRSSPHCWASSSTYARRGGSAPLRGAACARSRTRTPLVGWIVE